jgi:enoyl-CoA hydratase/carnithine racemase
MSEISLEENGRVLTIFINRENKLNPLNIETIEEIGEALKDESKIAVISGNNKAFSAGADIKVFLNLDPKTGFDFAKRGHDVMNFIQERRMPVIAAIHGFALGGGFELAMSCDLRISHPEAIFGLPEVTLGIIPGFGGTQRLRTLVGEGKAFQMASLGLKIKADEALKLGIVNELNEKYLERALELAKIYESLPYESVAYIKELIRGNHGNSYDREKEYFGNIFRTDNQKEGAKSFVEKRKPNFNKNIKKDL